MKVYVICKGRLDIGTSSTEVWDDEEIAKIRVRRISEAALIDAKGWGNKKIKVNKTDSSCAIHWINIENEKRTFVVFYTELELIETLKNSF